MSSLIANMSMSLDGFVEARDGGVAPLFAWYESGGRETAMPGDGRRFRTSAASADRLQTAVSSTGAVICGRRLFDLTRGWGGRHPVGAPVFVVTHRPPADWPHPDAPFTFVTGGVEAAVAQARAVAGEKTVAVASADIARQCLELGLLDAIHVDLVPVLLGAGKPWFAGLGDVVELEDPVITAGEGVTHLLYRVRRAVA
jgi:dihydrofolate reductase